MCAGCRLYHTSLRDFLSGNVPPEQLVPAGQSLVKKLAERTHQAHRWIAKHYRQATDGDWTKLAEADAGYGIRHLAIHLPMAGEWDALYALPDDLGLRIGDRLPAGAGCLAAGG